MSITAQAGVLGFGIQAGGAKGGSVTNWYKHRSADIDLAVMDDARIGPPEIGGVPTPTIPYKAGVAVSGGATIYPRLENTFGWLLLCALGDCSTIADKDIDGADHVGLYAHTFKFKSGAESFVPYMGFRKVIPHSDHTKALGEPVMGNCFAAVGPSTPVHQVRHDEGLAAKLHDRPDTRTPNEVA